MSDLVPLHIKLRCRWLYIALPEDYAQCYELAKLQAKRDSGMVFDEILRFHLRELRRTVWERVIQTPPLKVPRVLRPAAIKRRKTAPEKSAAYRAAALQLSPEFRLERARKGYEAARSRAKPS